MTYTLNNIHHAIKFTHKTKFERRDETESSSSEKISGQNDSANEGRRINKF